MDKLTVARMQLGTALHLFIRDLDPVSVHCLACGAAELLEGLALHSGTRVFTNHILENSPDLSLHELRRLRAKNWNSFKHFFASHQSELPRADGPLLDTFSDCENDGILFIAWADYATLAGTLPIAAQVFQIWYFASYPEKLAPDVNPWEVGCLFPELAAAARREKKRRLKRAVEHWEKDSGLLTNEATDPPRAGI